MIANKRIMMMVVWIATLSCNQAFGQDTAPVVSDIPDQTTGQGGAFDSINLATHLQESDGDEVGWSFMFGSTGQTDPAPDWTVEASAYEFNMNVTGRVSARGDLAAGSTHLLAAFAGDQIRGLTSAIEVGDEWLYFLTVYANEQGEEITFEFYDQSNSLLLPVAEKVEFEANDIVGSVVEPLTLRASYVLIDIHSGVADLHIVDGFRAFEEHVEFIATDLTEAGLSGSDEAVFTLIDDFSPVLAGISDQTIEFGEAFSSFDLDDYLTLRDADDVELSAAGQTELEVVIDSDNVVTISVPTDDWVGTEMISFTVTDISDNQLSSTDQVSFTVKPEDHAPGINEIPDQKTGLGGGFEPLNLDDYLVEIDGDQIEWSFRFAPNETPEEVPQWSVSPELYEFSMNMTVTVSSLGTSAEGDQHILAAFGDDGVRGTTQAVEVGGSWIYFLTVYGHQSSEELTFQFYDADDQRTLPVKRTVIFEPNGVVGDPVNPQQLEAAQIQISLTGSTIDATIINADFIGSEPLIFQVTDVNTAQGHYDADTVLFTVTNEVFPQVGNIPDQSIQEGDRFESIDLNSYLIEFEASDVNWEVSGADELTIILVDGQAIIEVPHSDWFGDEAITFVARDKNDADLNDAETVMFEVINVNDPPVFDSEPDIEVLVEANYVYLVEVSDVDHDALTLRVQELPDWLVFEALDNGKAVLFGTPGEGNIGDYAINIEALDAGGEPVIQSFNLEVVNVTDIGKSPVEEIVVFPNPTEDVINVHGVGIERLELIDRSSRSIFTTTDQMINVVDLNPGIYFLRVHSLKNKRIYKIIKR